jgi:hypothetical protein
LSQFRVPCETGSAKLAPPIWLGERGSVILKSKRNSAHHVIKRNSNPGLLSQVGSYDVASTIASSFHAF